MIVLLAFVLFCIYFYVFNPVEQTTHFIPCPTYSVFHLYCPGCGSQRAIHFLLHLDILQAMKYNPLLVVIFPICVYMGGVEIYNWIFDKKYRIMWLYNNKVIFFIFAVFVVYAILRNIPSYPFNLLAPHD